MIRDRAAESARRPDLGLDRAENKITVRQLLSKLPDRERWLLTRRFLDGMTQAKIAAEVGVSQMQISRLLNRSLTRLREQLSTDHSAAGARTFQPAR